MNMEGECDDADLSNNLTPNLAVMESEDVLNIQTCSLTDAPLSEGTRPSLSNNENLEPLCSSQFEFSTSSSIACSEPSNDCISQNTRTMAFVPSNSDHSKNAVTNVAAMEREDILSIPLPGGNLPADDENLEPLCTPQLVTCPDALSSSSTAFPEQKHDGISQNARTRDEADFSKLLDVLASISSNSDDVPANTKTDNLASSMSTIYLSSTHEFAETSEVARLRARRLSRVNQTKGSLEEDDQKTDPRFALARFAWGPADELKSLAPVCSHDEDLFADISCEHCAKKIANRRYRKIKKAQRCRGARCSNGFRSVRQTQRGAMKTAAVQAQEIIQDVPAVLNVERPVEVPQVMTAGAVTQVPVAQMQVEESTQIGEVLLHLREGVEPQLCTVDKLGRVIVRDAVGKTKRGSQFENLVYTPRRCKDTDKTSQTQVRMAYTPEEVGPLIQEASSPQPCIGYTCVEEIICDELGETTKSCGGALNSMQASALRTQSCEEGPTAMCPNSDFDEVGEALRSREHGSPEVAANVANEETSLKTPLPQKNPTSRKLSLSVPKRKESQKPHVATGKLCRSRCSQTSRKRVKPSSGFSDDDSDG